MDIHNIALVRATNVIPLDGVIRPLSNVFYLTKQRGTEFSSRMSDLLREMKIIPPMDYTKISEEGYYDKMVKQSASILEEYLPYTSDYNSMVLFSLNGLCPDDGEQVSANNTFSNKKCAIIEPLLPHIEQVISLVPTDTAIKGDVYLSEEAIILIEETTYQKLSESEKQMLGNRDVRRFTSSLKNAIFEALQKTEKFVPETLSLSVSTGGIIPSDTSEEQKKVINKIATVYGLSQEKYFHLITATDVNMLKYSEVSDEYQNMMIVQNYFLIQFLQELLVVLDASDDLIARIPTHLHSKDFMQKIIQLIKKFGLDNYKKFLDQYNSQLEEKKRDKTLMRPSEVVEMVHEQRQNGIQGSIK